MASSIHTTVHESLPYIERDPTQAEKDAAQALITAELPHTTAPTLAPLRTPNFTPAMESELARIAAGTSLTGIDSSRYELQDTPPADGVSSALSKAYATATYLSQRRTNLSLLEAYGKNAWLVSNWQVEADLAALEGDLAAVKREIDIVNIERRRRQDGVADEMAGLEETWKKGVGRVLETEVATEVLRQQVRERQREIHA